MSDTPRATGQRQTAAGRIPGDLTKAQLIARMIRVDHAGELGATRIYDGQLAVLRRTKAGPVIQAMADQEQRHLKAFDKLMVERRVRPTVLSPVWHAAGFALGAASALLGSNAAMACTEAVETEIEGHYARQAALLGDDEADLRSTIEDFRADEIAHRDTAVASGAEQAVGHRTLRGAVRAGTRLAIWLSERV